MGLHALTWALALVAWPRRSSKNTFETTYQSGQEVFLTTAGHTLEIPDYRSESILGVVCDRTGSADTSKALLDSWSKVVSRPDTPLLDQCRIPTDATVLAYFEWRMAFGQPTDDEEKIIYRDYLDQCELGAYAPLSLIAFGRGLVALGCEKYPVKKFDNHGKLRQPNVIKWPLQLGMT